jgi:DNA-binding NtrC family response regulator
VWLPPLRDRPDEVAYFVDRAARDVGAAAGASLVEACLLRPWPGNVRELVAEVRAASVSAVAAGAEEVSREHLAPDAGRSIRPGDPTPPSEPAPPPSESDQASDEETVRSVAVGLGIAQKTVRKLLSTDALRALAEDLRGAAPEAALTLLRAAAAAALRATLEARGHSQAAVAAELGVSRTTLGRLCEQLDLPRAVALSPAQVEAAMRAAEGDVDAAARTLGVSPAALKKRLAARPSGGD